VHAPKGPTTLRDKSRELQRKLYLSVKEVTKANPDQMWLINMGLLFETLECLRKKVVGKPYAGKPHVRFDVAGAGKGLSCLWR